MPFYEYQCQDCDHHVEALQKMSDDPLFYCPECNAPGLKKLISAAGFRLKGTGWYETDFKGNRKSDDKSSAKPTDNSTQADSKPAEPGCSKPSGDSKGNDTVSASA